MVVLGRIMCSNIYDDVKFVAHMLVVLFRISTCRCGENNYVIKSLRAINITRDFPAVLTVTINLFASFIVYSTYSRNASLFFYCEDVSHQDLTAL